LDQFLLEFSGLVWFFWVLKFIGPVPVSVISKMQNNQKFNLHNYGTIKAHKQEKKQRVMKGICNCRKLIKNKSWENSMRKKSPTLRPSHAQHPQSLGGETASGGRGAGGHCPPTIPNVNLGRRVGWEGVG
jgi:hypothetical protein